MGIKADVKAARARMQAGEPAEALSMVQKVLDAASPELQDDQIMYATLVTGGLAGLAAEDFTASERLFRLAADTLPDAPQAWKGLIECFERAGKVAALPECYVRAAEIAEGKGNFGRARTLRLLLGEVLDGLGRSEEALEAVLRSLEDEESTGAVSGGKGEESSMERLCGLMLAGVLEVSMEDVVIAKRVEKKLSKEAGITSATTNSNTSGSHSHRSQILAFEYRVKTIAKDDELRGPVATRLADAIEALLQEAGGGVDHGIITDSFSIQRRQLLERFCRTLLRRAVQRAESQSARPGAWGEVVVACDALTEATGVNGWDGGWVAAVMLLSSTYHPVDARKLLQIAEDGAHDELHPWLSAECNLYLAAAALCTGDAGRGRNLLHALARARAKCAGDDAWMACLDQGTTGESCP